MMSAGVEPIRTDVGAEAVDTGIETRPHVLVKRSLSALEPRLDEMFRRFYGVLFSMAPEMRSLFPIDMSTQRARLGRALRHVINSLDDADPQPFLAQLGRDHRKFGIADAHYDVFGRALLIAVSESAGAMWTPEVAVAWQRTYAEFADVMRGAARAETAPASWSAAVVAHQRVGHDLALVQLRTDPVFDISPGQYVAVEIPQRPRVWAYFSPANLPATDGFVELYVKAVRSGGLSRAIVSSTRPGDRWRIGPPMGRLNLHNTAGRNLLMVGGGTGIAPIHSIARHVADSRDHPDYVSVFYGARTADELHALPALRSLSYRNDWLTVTAAVEGGTYEAGTEVGSLAEIVTRYGSWPDFEVILSGSPAMLRATATAMLTAGTPRERIHFDPFTID
jgi:NAD(P)H-flavin reductase/hemoglobin-like flavoprotein